jgi:antibiotic biosynthesis monooxygenase (ABM) superfamily enzyme
MEEFVDGRTPAPGDDPPVTAVASRRVKQGREQEFEEWLSGILAAANEAPGYLGSEVLRPSDSKEDNEYRIVFRFDHASNLRAWENSEERQHWLRKVDPLQQEEKVHVLTGLETWFTLPSKVGEPYPPRYKMVAVTWLGVFPIVTIIFSVFGHESAPNAGAHASLYGGDGDAYDLCGHAAHDALVFLLALPGSPRVALNGATTSSANLPDHYSADHTEGRVAYVLFKVQSRNIQRSHLHEPVSYRGKSR